MVFYWGYCILRLIRYSERGQVLLRASGINLQRLIGLILGVIIFLMLGRLFFDYAAFAWPLTLKLTPRIGDICFYMLILTLGIQSIIWRCRLANHGKRHIIFSTGPDQME